MTPPPRFSVHFETLGCRLNQTESENMAKAFFDAGFSPDREAAGSADVPLCVVNTCTVTGKAEQKARRLIRLLLSKFPRACVLVTGCYAELDGGALAAMNKRIAVLPFSRQGALPRIAETLRGFLADGADGEAAAAFLAQVLSALCTEDGAPDDRFRLETSTFFAHSRPSLKIQDGCDRACSYCRVRLARGSPVSLDAALALERVRRLEVDGHREVTLTGANLSLYRSPYRGAALDLARLLGLLLERTSAISIRLSSLHPDTVGEAFCAVARGERVRPHFHLSVQSLSDSVLRGMNRPYRAAAVLEAVARLRAAKDAPFLACDIIAGFPGETDADFAETLARLRECNFAWIHAFPFSPRPGTPAAALKQVPSAVKAERARALQNLAVASKCAYIAAFAGWETSAIIERPASCGRTGGAALRGVTANFIHVEIANPRGEALAGGSEAAVRILSPLPDRIARGGECEALAELTFGRAERT
ncbi:MiaB/RimO family radical SAM methylthiotransferase [Treponema endosymbiont of Eucomonympha sp.]|uniref:MiaB/RimO family radical SAM methylthiotransferase n=1 Tax=Treponema endosymbiont of Eucomonympha sp. TaxID=1580831 RepID=UPI0007518EAF|nr:MiaB/RimO family radical SAM methylthiotransferase [Treponema endosymbiont of Eucomonympha sp.]